MHCFVKLRCVKRWCCDALLCVAEVREAVGGGAVVL